MKLRTITTTLRKAYSYVTPLVGIDLGSSRIRIWNDTKGFVIDEACCLAVDERSKKVLAVGDEALAMQGRVSTTVEILHPVRGGEMADAQATKALIQVLLQRVFAAYAFFRPVVMVSLPAHLSPAKRDATTQMLAEAGAREVVTISQSLAAAIGAGVPIADVSGCFMCQLGSGVIEASIVSLGSTVTHQSSTTAGAWFDQRLSQMIRNELGLAVGADVIEVIKRQVVSFDQNDQRSQVITGQDTASNAPREVEITSEQCMPVAIEFVTRLEPLLHKVLAQVPPELTVDIVDKGLLLSGGLAQLHSLDRYLVHSLDIPVSVVDEPQETVVQGLALALEHLDEFKQSLGYLT